MDIKINLERDLKDALRNRDELLKTTLRMVLSAVKLKEVEKRAPLDASEVLMVLQREVKARQESITDARKANRPDLAAAAEAEIEILNVYLPQKLTDEEIERLVRETIAEVGANSMNEMGQVMKAVMPKIRGRADGGDVNRLVRAILSQG